MSMIGNFRRCEDSQIEELLKNPDTVTAVIYPEEEELAEDLELDVDKAWQGIHFLLCDSPWEGEGPLSFILNGGKEIGTVDVGYGPARSFNSLEVKEISQLLEGISVDDLAKKCNHDLFEENGIYPSIWHEEFDDCFGYLLSYYEDLKEFLLKTAENNSGILVYIN